MARPLKGDKPKDKSVSARITKDQFKAIIKKYKSISAWIDAMIEKEFCGK